MNEQPQANIMYEERGEDLIYASCGLEEEILLPLTKSGFEAFLAKCASIHNLPVDDKMRQVLAGYIHHIGNEVNTCTIKGIAKILHKSIVNSTTWQIDQECKAVEKQRQIKMQEALQQQVVLDRKQKSEARKNKYKSLNPAPSQAASGPQQ